MSQPISTTVEERINREFISAKASGVDVPSFLKSLFNTISAYRSVETPMESGFAYDEENSDGLDMAVTAGRYHTGRGYLHEVAADTVTLTDNATNYVFIDIADDSLNANTSGFTADHLPLFQVTTVGGEITAASRVLPRLMIVDGEVIGANQLSIKHPDTSIDAIPPTEVRWEFSDEESDIRGVSFEINHGDNALIGDRIVEVFLADSPGGWLTSTAADGGVAGDIYGQLETLDTGKRVLIKIRSGESYFGFVNIEHSGTKSWYVGLIVSGQVFYSPILAFS